MKRSISLAVLGACLGLFCLCSLSANIHSGPDSRFSGQVIFAGRHSLGIRVYDREFRLSDLVHPNGSALSGTNHTRYLPRTDGGSVRVGDYVRVTVTDGVPVITPAGP